MENKSGLENKQKCDKKVISLSIFMTPPFLFLLAAAGIFRLLSADAKKAFRRCLARLLPRKVMQQHLRVLLEDYPERLGEFRRRVLPFFALHVTLNAAACACFVAAIWMFPPSGMSPWDLLFVRYGSVLLVPVAFLADTVWFARILMATFGRGGKLDIRDSKFGMD